MQKGQITFDFIFALVVFLTISGLLFSFSKDFKASQQNVLAKIESERISADAASAAIYSKVIPVDYFSYFYTIPPMNATGSSGTYPCTLTAAPGILTVSVDSGKIESVFSSPLLDTSLNGKNCGDQINLVKT